MKTAIRNHAAAALLLLPLAAAVLVAQPAHAQQYRVAEAQQAHAQQYRAVVARPAPAIERFVLSARGRIEPGSELRFRLVGAPGGDAWFDIPGVIRGVDLQETRPGVYEGTYTVRRRDDPRAFPRAIATLRAGNQRAIARVDMRGDDHGPGRDFQAPNISDVTPGDGVRVDDRGRVHVFARLGDEGSGVDPATVRLRIDGRDVTGTAQVSAEEVRFRSDLPNGRHTAELEVRDRAGNAARKAWSFDVVDTDGHRDGRRS